MYPNLDNFENNISDNANIINQEINEQHSIFNNSNYFTLNFNFLNHGENKDLNTINNNSFLSSLINRNMNIINDLGFNNKSHFSKKISNIENKNKKIFVISHNKRESDVNLDLENKIKNKIKKINYLDTSFCNNKKNNLLINNIQKEKIKEKFKRDGKHDKFTDDNLRRKCKHLVLNSVIELINKRIFSIYDGNIGNNIFRKEILTLNKFQISNANIEFDRILIHKKISDILSENISSRYTNYIPQHNKLLIERLKNESDDKKNFYFNKLFNLTFFDCMEHFIGKKYFEELEGMICYESIGNTLDENEEYINIIKFYLENFEKIINNKKARKSKKRNKINNNNI